MTPNIPRSMLVPSVPRLDIMENVRTREPARHGARPLEVIYSNNALIRNYAISRFIRNQFSDKNDVRVQTVGQNHVFGKCRPSRLTFVKFSQNETRNLYAYKLSQLEVLMKSV